MRREFRALGMATYSSAIFNFVPRTAIAFHRAVHDGDDATVQKLTTEFLEPYVRIRKKQPGYAVSIVKAGADIVGRPGGKVRPPLTDLTAEERRRACGADREMGPQEGGLGRSPSSRTHAETIARISLRSSAATKELQWRFDDPHHRHHRAGQHGRRDRRAADRTRRAGADLARGPQRGQREARRGAPA